MAKGTRARRIKRIMDSSLGDFVRECQGYEEGREQFRRTWSGGFGYSDSIPYVSTPLGTHRDADALQESNWDVITREMDKVNHMGTFSDYDSVVYYREGSCLNGWNESVQVRMDDAVAIKAAMDIVSALANYPILDEEDYSEREWNANHPGGGKCYGDCCCSCADGEHDRLNDQEEHKGCRAWLAGSLESQDAPGWRSFEGNDVEEEHEEYGYRAEGVYTLDNYQHDRTDTWQWYCSADGCGTWIDASPEDIMHIRKHNLFSDIPEPVQQLTIFDI